MKHAFLLVLALIVLPHLISCRNEQIEEIENEILALREENVTKAKSEEEVATDGINETEADETEKQTPDLAKSDTEIADSLTQSGEEKQPRKNKPETDWDGILSSEYQLAGNKYYFHTMEWKQVNGSEQSVTITSYIDLTTGETGVICPDPLCQHNDPAVCKYISLNSVTDFMMADANTYLCGYRTNPNSKTKICAFDLRQDNYRVLFTPKQYCPDLLGMENGILWLREYYSKTSQKKTTNYQSVIGVRISDGEIVYTNTPPEDAKAFFFHDGLIYCDNVKSIIAFEPKTGDVTTLLSYAAADQVGAWYYDTLREEFWFSIINKEKKTGRVYRYSVAEGNCEEVPFLCGEVYYFQLTHSRIFYSPYEPLYLGENPSVDYGTWDYTGGKIYAVDRDEPSQTPELIYDAEGKYIICNIGVQTYTVFGDKLYLNHVDIIRQKRKDPNTGEMRNYVYFSLAEKEFKIRIDLSSGDEEEIHFE